jgi:hypothetical protein
MAKKATPEDYKRYANWQEAQNLSRYGAREVPKKPVAVSGKKTVPEVLDWGSGIPKDYLAYLNKQEMALVQKARKYKGKRSYKGIPAYPDPGDTGAGDRGQGTSSSAGLGNNNSSGTYGGGGGRDSGSLGGGGMGSYNSSNSNVGGREGGGGNTSVSGVGGGVGSQRSSTDSASRSPQSSVNSQDKSAMQSAAESDAVKISRESPALRADAALGGIRSIGVGPEDNKINISNPSDSAISGALSRVSSQTYARVASRGMPSPASATPTSPGGGGMGQFNERRGSSVAPVRAKNGMEAPGNIAPTYRALQVQTMVRHPSIQEAMKTRPDMRFAVERNLVSGIAALTPEQEAQGKLGSYYTSDGWMTYSPSAYGNPYGDPNSAFETPGYLGDVSKIYAHEAAGHGVNKAIGSAMISDDPSQISYNPLDSMNIRVAHAAGPLSPWAESVGYGSYQGDEAISRFSEMQTDAAIGNIGGYMHAANELGNEIAPNFVGENVDPKKAAYADALMRERDEEIRNVLENDITTAYEVKRGLRKGDFNAANTYGGWYPDSYYSWEMDNN